MPENVLYYGDNLDILRRYVDVESIDLVYLDPPFKSNQDYNVLFQERNGSQAAAQVKAFEDTWSWDTSAAGAFHDVVQRGGHVADALVAFEKFLGHNDMLAYLSMMAPRLIQLRRVLKPTGSLYLHCDPTASHYLKILTDAVFGPENFKNEISWKRTTTKSDYREGATNWPRIRDALLYYCKDQRANTTFHQQFAPYTQEYVDTKYRHVDPNGRRYMLDKLTAPGSGMRGHPKYEFMGITRHWVYNQPKMEALLASGRIVQPSPGTVPRFKRYLDEVQGVAIGDTWDDIYPINSMANERLGYPTQKPEALLERIVRTSSNEGDTVLDPFCGCGTAIAVAQRLNRHWIGIDITHLAISLMKHRLKTAFGDAVSYRVIGEPVSLPDAEILAQQDPYQFQWWALGLVGARPVEQKKGSDKGIDGRLYFFPNRSMKGQAEQIIFSVKAGNVTVSHLRDLSGVLLREKAAIGVLITMNPPTGPMVTEAASSGFYSSSELGRKNYPRLQILTIEDLLNGKKVDCPPFAAGRGNVTFKSSPESERPRKEAATKASSIHEFDADTEPEW